MNLPAPTEAATVSVPQGSKHVFVLTDKHGRQIVRLSAMGAVRDTCDFIDAWSRHQKVWKCLFSNIQGYTYIEDYRLQKKRLIDLLDVAPVMSRVTLFVCNTDEESIEISIVKTEVK